MSERKTDQAFWRRPAIADETEAHQIEDVRQQHLLLDPRYPLDSDRDVLDPMYRSSKRYWFFFALFAGLVLMMFTTWTVQMWLGLGITGLKRPTMWALYIVNFVYFIGIGHAGTFISAALRVLKVEWRRPISRAAELVTVFGLMTAALFPLIHLGRTWKFYWLIPYPNERQLWPSFHSPLLWDLTAITTYLSCSILFAYISLLPDLAMARDHTSGWRHILYSVLALGWRGTEREWSNHETALNIFSYAIIPVMFSVHTIVSWDFAMAIQPGWHSTIFGPYFVVGALFSGAGAVIIALTIIRKAMRLQYFLRTEHLEGMAKLMLLLSFAWDYFYFNDVLVPWYGQAPVEKSLFALFASGRVAPLFYLMIFANAIVPVTLVFKRVRTSIVGLFIVSLFIQIGMYIERFLIVPVGLGQNEIPFAWGVYVPYLPESLISIGAFGLVIFLFFLISRFFPLIPSWEVYEGQVLQGLRRIGRAILPTRAEPD